MSPPDPFALGRQDHDATVRRLFWRWRAAQRAYGMTDGDEDAAYEQICVIEDQILAMQGPAAMAIKAYFVITRADILGRSSIEGVRSFISDYSAVSEEIIVSLLRDAVAFVPELAPLAVSICEPHVAGADSEGGP